MLKEYERSIDKLGLDKAWDLILQDDSVSMDDYGYLYEAGLAYTNKIDKKEQGKYYTPEDVANLLADFFKDLSGENICDVCCGTGNLIKAYLKSIGEAKARKLIADGHLYLYDRDSLALKITKASLAKLYGEREAEKIHCISGDFLDEGIHLPKKAKVISNPPYSMVKQLGQKWKRTEVSKKTKELYAMFMEKIISESESSVLITPFSFLGSRKYEPLRVFMNDYTGMIFSFDNVPSNIFNGRKHGVFNTNSTNSVRASITIVEKPKPEQDLGFRISPLLRFQSSERERLLKKETLLDLLPETKQLITTDQPMYSKVFKELEPVYKEWRAKAQGIFADLLTEEKTPYQLTIPTTCRYFTTATVRDLDRAGKKVLYFKDRESMDYGYCLFNSSFAYWYWMIFDGAITYPDYLLKTIPINFDKDLMEKHRSEIEAIQKSEDGYLSYKLNAKKMQETVKLPESTREELNHILFSNFNIQEDPKILDVIHQNHIF